MKLEEDFLLLPNVKRLVEALATKDSAVLKQSGFLGPSTVDEYLNALNDYLGAQSTTSIPDAELKNIVLYPTQQEGRFRADIDLWVDGMRSDLTAIVYLDKTPNSPKPFELYDLRVL